MTGFLLRCDKTSARSLGLYQGLSQAVPVSCDRQHGVVRVGFCRPNIWDAYFCVNKKQFAKQRENAMNANKEYN